MVTVMMN